jgi:hypothetical protein
MRPTPRHLWGADIAAMARAVIPRPALWGVAVAALARLARRGWWHRPPFLPVPGDDYWRFRVSTALGGTGEDAALSSSDVVAYLQWCRRTHPRRG